MQIGAEKSPTSWLSNGSERSCKERTDAHSTAEATGLNNWASLALCGGPHGWFPPARRDHERATASMAMGYRLAQDRNLSQDIQCRASAAVSSERITGPIRRVACVFLVYTVFSFGGWTRARGTAPSTPDGTKTDQNDV